MICKCGHELRFHHKGKGYYPCGFQDPVDSCMNFTIDNLKYLEDLYDKRKEVNNVKETR